MEYNFQNSLKIRNKMTKQQQKDYVDKNFNDPTYKRFASDLLEYQKNGSTGSSSVGTNVGTNVGTSKNTTIDTGIPTKNNVTATSSNTVTNSGTTNGYNTGGYTGYRRTGDTFGDSGYSNEKSRYTGTNTTGSLGFSYDPNYKFNNLPTNMRFGNSAMGNGYLTTRNNQLAMAFFNEGKTDADSIYNYLMQYGDFAGFDEGGRRNTVNAIINRIGSLQNELNNQKKTTSQAQNRGDIGILGTDNPATGDYWTNVNRVMRQSQGFGLEEMKNMYPEDYQDMYDALAQVESIWNSTNPEQRKELDARIQEIVGAGVGTGSDRSVINRYEEAIGSKFRNPEQISKDMQDVLNYRTRGLTTDEIASKLGMTPDQVTQLILLANGDRNSRAGDYYQLTDTTRKQVTEPYDIQRDRLQKEKDIALERANQQAERLKEDFDTAYERQKKQNDINSHNAHFLASKYGFAFSDRGLQGLQYIGEQAQNILDDLIKNYDRGNEDIANGIADIIRNWQWNNDDLIRESENALRDAKNSYLSGMLGIQQKYGVLGQQAQAMYSQGVQNFITQAEDIYDRALARQQQNFTNFINNVANLNALAVNDFNMKQKLYEQFTNVAMSMNGSQARQYAQQNGLDYNTIQAYQLQMAQNALNGVNAGAGMQFANELQNDISLGYSPLQAVQNVMKSKAYKDAYPQGATGGMTDKNGVPLEQYSMNSGVLYNKYTGQRQDLNQVANGGTGNAQFDKDGKLQTYSNGSWYIGDDGQFHQIGTTGSSSDNSGTWVKLDDGRIMNNKTGEIRESNYAQSWLSNEQIVSGLQSFMKGKKKGDWGGQCGKFVNDYLESLGLGRLFKDPITDKKAVINTEEGYVPKAGDIVVMDSPSSPKYGHVAIVVQNKDGVITTLESNGSKGDEKIFTRQFKPNSSKATKVYGYYTPQGESVTVASKAPEKESSSSSKTEKATQDLDYYGTADVATLTKQLFGGNASDSDREMIRSLVQQGYAQGKTRKEILYDGAGYRINENSDKGFADKLMSYMEKRTDPKEGLVGTYDLQSIASRINAGDWGGAIQNMESAMISQFGNPKTSPDLAISMVDKLETIQEEFKKIEGKTGRLTMYDILTKNAGWLVDSMQATGVSKADAQAFAQVATDIQQVYAEIRNQLAGTAVTENETKWLSDMIPSLRDNSTTFKTKIKSAITNIFKDQNATRKQLGLPVFQNTEQLRDWNARASLYGKSNWNTTGNKIK